MPKMMEISKILLYCCKAMPYLINTKLPIQKWELHDKKYEVCKEHYVNGKVCFECDCKEAKQLYIYESESPDDEFHSFGNCDFVKENFRRMGLSGDAESTGNILDKYGNYWLYFYHFENVKPIDPFPITHLFKDEMCETPLTRAPQSYYFAYGIRDRKPIKFLVFSIRSNWLCKIANGEKDLEVRKQRILNAGIEYK
jgi:hypothetical protein